MTVETPLPGTDPGPVKVKTGGGPEIPSARAAKAARRKALTPYLLLLPAVVATLVLLGWPLVKNLVLSFQNLNMRQFIQRVTEWTGFHNYQDVLGGEEFWRVTLRSVLFTGVNVILIMALGSLIGLLLARLGRRMRVFLLIGLVLAWAMPVIAATTVYQWLFAERFGVVNYVLDKLGWHSMADFSWTSSQLSTFFVITWLIVWQSIPFVAINLYAATTTIPKELYEAASLDGAGAWKSFKNVTFPFLRPFLFATTFLEVIWVFKAFAQVFAFNQGGPDRLTEILPVYAYIEGMGNQHFGMGAAISFLTLLILLGLTSYYLRIVLKQGEDEL
ncbi:MULTISPECIES: carbohydrate ABC transporter permease [Streptomyces]|uniref:carbohydrate ABC transporter permease n=1 Tax=Streptomyces TaxID=1883 RepID=UPI0002F3799B|nr:MULTISPECIES: sugar ABC transporter permease [unclassified Streptomyces]MYQ57219.1 ABC transporter permease subunit [Streptomyces sp. SID4926]MYR30633.1 ABC transporter permease subunit [Streptomyces sp. SID4945]SCD53883.1 carbohydrate ABC transporter membrane protein 1, CUT1 family [Streptomyces sp. DfronAA-171]SCF50278.1 carbohydrate ABC transporter membrane protein 1, CUT1 family [Streptomyces sp. LcepLS]